MKRWAAGSRRAAVLHPWRPGEQGQRSPEARLEEAVGLAQAIGLEVVAAELARLTRPRPATLLGGGLVERYAAQVPEREIEVVVIDGVLSPVQQRNLEKAWHCKVIDRTGLILEIFAERARTREGRLQVELAQLTYQRSRLVRSWTHLERQRGGLGTVGGPGETQIEADRRMIDERVVRLRRELEEVSRTRELQRKNRREAPWPVVALVGYTNAGKSTLFNRLTGAEVFAEDQLFATLDPTMRGITLPSGRRVILSDTVGFISDLPTHLVAAFRATLEEVLEASIILHVRDITHPDTEAQKADVLAVLRDLGLGEGAQERMLEVLNKVDLADPADRERVRNLQLRNPDLVAISALGGQGCDALLAAIDRALDRERNLVEVDLDPADGATMAWLYRRGEVLSREDRADAVRLVVNLDAADAARLRKRLPDRTVLPTAAQ
ncbi:MAG TPA: GTPase HflX [Alphaproteobacteria bacterium]|jgi:GTP-binding protein HflX|nr:GTPase HflX [Alphaproteobacteria bacterium]